MIYGIIKGQHLSLKAYAVADSIDYLTASFTFISPDWEGLTVYAHFTKGDETHSVELADGKITEADHLNLSEGEWGVYLHGNEYKNGDVLKRITTNIEKFSVEPTGTLDGDPFPEVEASIVEQFAADLEEMDERISGLENAVEDVQDAEGNSLVTDKVAHLPEIPAKTSDLTNDSGFITNAVNDLLNYYTKQEADGKGAIELYDSATGKPAYGINEIDAMYSAGKLLKWKGKVILSIYANTMWNRMLFYADNINGRLQFYKQSIQQGAVIGDPEALGGASEVNFTAALYNKLAGIEAGAEVNDVTDVKDSNGNSLVSGKVATLPAYPVVEYTEIFDGTQSNYTGTEIYNLWTAGKPLAYTRNGATALVTQVRQSTESSVSYYRVYYVKSQKDELSNDVFARAGSFRIPVDGKTISNDGWYSSTVLADDIDKLSGGSVSQGNTSFVTGGQVYDAVSAKQDTLTAGTNITISNNVISATGGASSADDVSYDNTDSGLTATNVQDAIDEVVTGKQNKLTAGSNITIQNDVISASGGSLPSATTELDVLYWHNGEWTTGAITNVIPNGDNLSY